MMPKFYLYLVLLKSKQSSTGSIWALVIQDKSLFIYQNKGAELTNLKKKTVQTWDPKTLFQKHDTEASRSWVVLILD